MSNNKEIMSRNIKFYLNKKGLNAKDFAKQISIPYTTVLDWVNGNSYPRIDKIEKMAHYFNIDKSQLVEASDHSSANSDLDKMLDIAESYDGKPMTDNDREAIRIFLEGRFSNK